jgi:hypothetical protein
MIVHVVGYKTSICGDTSVELFRAHKNPRKTPASTYCGRNQKKQMYIYNINININIKNVINK